MSREMLRIQEILADSENQKQLLDTLSPVQRTVAEEVLRVEE